jgi:polysaccharide biosynthesis protein PslH
MKLLFLTSRLPYPPFQGDRLKIYNILRILSRKHQITLLSFSEDSAESILSHELGKFCHRIETIILPKSKSYLNILTGLFNSQPFQVSYYQSSDFQGKLNQLLTEDSYDLIHTHLIRMVPYSADLQIPKVLDLTDAISEYLKTRYETTSNPIIKAGVFIEWQRMLRYEPILQKFNRISVCSEPDRDNLLKTAPTAKIEVIRNGLDIDYFKPNRAQQPEPNTIIFTGNMTYAPNEDGLMYFYREILPLIRQTIPTVKFYIVGKDPSPTVQKLAAEDVVVTGKVTDLRTYYSLAQVSICPIRFGAGTLNKVIEPMAMGIPVVSTSISCVGMNVTPIQDPNFDSKDYNGENIVFADTPATFAQSVINLLQQPELREKIGKSAIELVKAEHDWESIVAKLERIYAEIVGSE